MYLDKITKAYEIQAEIEEIVEVVTEP